MAELDKANTFEIVCAECNQEKVVIVCTENFHPMSLRAYCGACKLESNWKVTKNNKAELRRVDLEQTKLAAHIHND